ncbi:hypothetical protein [Streptomyces sp. NPDC059063]|uniref:hypothetical protein n=1 Tax=unclassified Streptomyces TaxID=2593676 RepID=UPI003680238A
MNANSQYPARPAGGAVGDADIVAALIPDTPAALTPAPAPAPIPDTATLIALAEQQLPAAASGTAVERSDTDTDTAVSPLVPRWVWRTSATVTVFAVLVALIAVVVWGVSALLGAAAAGMTEFADAVAPYAVGALVVVVLAALALTRRKRDEGEFEITQTQTQIVRYRR